MRINSEGLSLCLEFYSIHTMRRRPLDFISPARTASLQQTGSPEGQTDKLPRLRFLKWRVGEFSIPLRNCHVTVWPFVWQPLSSAKSIPYTPHLNQSFLGTARVQYDKKVCQYFAPRDLTFGYSLQISLLKTFRFLLNLQTWLWYCECCYRWVMMILSSMSSFSSSVSSVLFCLASSAAAAAAAFGSSASFFLRIAFLLCRISTTT